METKTIVEKHKLKSCCKVENLNMDYVGFGISRIGHCKCGNVYLYLLNTRIIQKINFVQINKGEN